MDVNKLKQKAFEELGRSYPNPTNMTFEELYNIGNSHAIALVNAYIKGHQAKSEVEDDFIDLLASCKKLLMHRNQGNLHPIDYKRIEVALDVLLPKYCK